MHSYKMGWTFDTTNPLILYKKNVTLTPFLFLIKNNHAA